MTPNETKKFLYSRKKDDRLFSLYLADDGRWYAGAAASADVIQLTVNGVHDWVVMTTFEDESKFGTKESAIDYAVRLVGDFEE